MKTSRQTLVRRALLGLGLALGLALFAAPASAQSAKNDIAIDALPAEVKQTLASYVALLRGSADLDACAAGFVRIAGGGLVDQTGSALRSSVKPYSLKKDFGNIKFYANPLVITRVNATPSGAQGFGGSAIKGMVYKIWIGKAKDAGGMPAPVSIMVPEGHATITTPRVVNIGSF
jgi:hypothetical protein